MASYARAADVRAVLTGDPDSHDDATPAGWDDDTLAAHLAVATAEVDAALAGRYRVPFDPPPALVVTVTAALAAWHATLSLRRTAVLDDRDPTEVRRRWAADLLARIATGAADLPGADQPRGTRPATGRAAVVQPYQGRLFTPAGFGLTDEQRRGGRRGPLR